MIPGAATFLSDPETVATAQNFLYHIAQNCVVGAITEWKNKGDNARAQKTVDLLSSAERSKSLTERIAQKITLCLNISKQEFDLLLPAASDQVLAAELAQQIASDWSSAKGSLKFYSTGRSPRAEPRL